MRFLPLVLLLSGATTSTFAQPGDLKVPTMGFAYDAAMKAIRPIRGIPGAALWGGAAGDGGLLSTAAVSPTQDFALAVAEGDSHLQVVRLTGDGAAAPVRGARASSKIIFSPLGRSAVLVAETGLQVLSGLPDSPVARDIATPDGGPWTAIAISDDGMNLLLAGAGDGADPVWLITGEEARQVAVPGSTAAVAFRAESDDAVAVTRGGDVYLFRGAGRNAETRLVHTGDERTAGPAAVYFSADGRHAYMANRSGILAILDVSTASVAVTSCQCTPSTFDPLQAATLFRITEIPAGPVMLFDVRGVAPRVWFVPSDAAAGQSRGREQQ